MKNLEQFITPGLTTGEDDLIQKYGFNTSPAEPGYVLPLQTMYIQISWLLKKPTDLDLQCLQLSM